MNRFKQFFRYNQFNITIAIIAINIAVYIYTSIKYSFSMNGWQGYLAGGFWPYMMQEEFEIYRFVTANFIHYGITHLLVNMMSAWNLGRVTESIYSTKNYLIILVSSMFSTTIFTYIIYLVTGKEYGVSGGFSGVICGVLGSLLYLTTFHKRIYSRLFQNVLMNVGLMLLISFSVPSISWTGHIGGLIGGFIAAYYIDLPGRLAEKRHKNQYFH